MSFSFVSSKMSQTTPRLTVAVFDITLGKLWVKSTQGLMRTPPAGNGLPRSRSTVNNERHKPAPAESPATTIFSGGTGECNAEGGGSIRYRSDSVISIKKV